MTQIAPRPQTRLPGASPLGSRRPPLLREVYGRLIRRLRGRQGRTLTHVAARAGVSVAYLSEIERGLKEPSSEVLEAVCTALGSSIAHLVGAAHRELVLESTASSRIPGPAPDAAVNTQAPDETSAGVLDLTRRHPGRSSIVSNPKGVAPAHCREAGLTAA